MVALARATCLPSSPVTVITPGTPTPAGVRSRPLMLPGAGAVSTSSPAAAAISAPVVSCGTSAATGFGLPTNQDATAATTHTMIANQKAAVSPSENGAEISCGKKLRPVRKEA